MVKVGVGMVCGCVDVIGWQFKWVSKWVRECVVSLWLVWLVCG